MDILGIIALVLTAVLGLAGAAIWGKVGKVITVINKIAIALSDKQITKEELEDILKALK